MNEQQICDRLVEKGREIFNSSPQKVIFTKNEEADNLLNDLQRYPHAFVLACIMDRQIKAERAWLIPYHFYQKLGDFSFDTLANLSREEIVDLMQNPKPLHRFVEQMAENLFEAVKLIKLKYSGNASLIWANNPPSAEVVYRFLEFKGVGPKIASMAANILARDFKVPFSDYYSIDISADVHVRRVFERLGLCPPNPSVEQVIFKARALYPKFPGIMDLPCWEIGRNWCSPKNPDCKNCYMNQLCTYR